jgi:hypothetical protein
MAEATDNPHGTELERVMGDRTGRREPSTDRRSLRRAINLAEKGAQATREKPESPVDSTVA